MVASSIIDALDNGRFSLLRPNVAAKWVVSLHVHSLLLADPRFRLELANAISKRSTEKRPWRILYRAFPVMCTLCVYIWQAARNSSAMVTSKETTKTNGAEAKLEGEETMLFNINRAECSLLTETS